MGWRLAASLQLKSVVTLFIFYYYLLGRPRPVFIFIGLFLAQSFLAIVYFIVYFNIHDSLVRRKIVQDIAVVSWLSDRVVHCGDADRRGEVRQYSVMSDHVFWDGTSICVLSFSAADGIRVATISPI